jgi:AhpD family alkylhydroperoxidase
MTDIRSRMTNVAMLVPESMNALMTLAASVEKGSVDSRTLELVALRASQINGCSVCIDIHSRRLRKAGVPEEHVFASAAWRDAPYYSESERAALALAEAVTRLSDNRDPVPDDIWAEAARHFDEAGLASLLIAISSTNLWNRLNVATRQVSGPWTAQY